jgi:hypothetical protein
MDALHARGISCVYGTVRYILAGKETEARATRQRFAPMPINDRVARLPAIDSPAMRTMRTMYPSTVVAATEAPVLKSGIHSSKIGGRVLKGRWRGLPIYTLTLEERATCPISCRHLRSCFGNKMQWAIRFEHGELFERRLVENAVALARMHPGGYVVRVHVLGDFYSVEYVRLWRAMIETIPELRVFGYTARWEDDIGETLRGLVRDHWNRFAVRFSNAPHQGVAWDMPATLSIELPAQRPADAFVCPEQWTPSGKNAESCSDCGACWSTKKRVCFLQH